MKVSIRKVSLLMLAAILVVVPLFSVACSDDEKATIEAKFSVSETTGVAPLTVTFTDESTSTGDITEWLWDFGDGEVSTDQNPSHEYAEVGLYTVILTVTGSEGVDTEAKVRYISATAVEYPQKLLTLSTASGGIEPAYAAAQEFADLLEGYTGGKVKVTVYSGATLYTPQQEFDMLKLQAVDITWQSPVILRMLGYGYSLDPFTCVDRMLPSITFANELIEDGRVMGIVADKLEDLGVKFLGATDSTLLGGLFTTVKELTSLDDCTGLKFSTNYPGVKDPWHEYAGFDCTYVPYADRLASVALGTINTMTASIGLARTQAYPDTFDHGLMWVAYSPYYGMMNLDTWNSLGTDLQDLITNKIMPEVVAFSQEFCLDAHKADCRYLANGLETLNLETPAMSQAVWDVIKDYTTTQAVLAKLDTEMLSIINELRPATWVIDPEIEEIMDYISITIE